MSCLAPSVSLGRCSLPKESSQFDETVERDGRITNAHVRCAGCGRLALYCGSRRRYSFVKKIVGMSGAILVNYAKLIYEIFTEIQSRYVRYMRD